MPRVVLDTNVIISGTIASQGSPARILDAWRDGRIDVITCPKIVAEVAEKLRLPRISERYRLSIRQIDELVDLLSTAAELVPGTEPVSPAPPDPDDTMLFAATLESDAEWIVTGDAKLHTFGWPGPGRVIAPREFCDTILTE